MDNITNFSTLLMTGYLPATKQSANATKELTAEQKKLAGAMALLPPALKNPQKPAPKAPAPTPADLKAQKEHIAQLEQEQYALDQLTFYFDNLNNALVTFAKDGTYATHTADELTTSLNEMQKAFQQDNNLVPDVEVNNAAINAALQESNAKIQIAQRESEFMQTLHENDMQVATEMWSQRLELVNKYAGEVSTILSGLSALQAQNEANQLAQAGDNEAKQLEIKRKFAKRQAGISAVQAVISGLAGAQKTLETLGLPLAIPFLAAQTAITAANVAGIIKNAGQFYTGGYTGDGGKYEPAGVVHKGEFVVNKAATQAIGVDNLYRMQSAATGYANGGYVNAANATRPLNDAIAAAKFMPAPVLRVSDLQRVSGQMVRVNNNAR